MLYGTINNVINSVFFNSVDESAWFSEPFATVVDWGWFSQITERNVFQRRIEKFS
jgi:hypothetical protein